MFLDSDDILRVEESLLKNLSLSYDQKHSMLLPKGHEFTRKVIQYYPGTNLHAGPQIELSLLCQKFRFVDGRSVVRWQLRTRLQCITLNLKIHYNQGEISCCSNYTNSSLYNVGLDFSGPFFIKFTSYICLAVQLLRQFILNWFRNSLLQHSLFLRRFISKIGCPSKIMSDNWLNFEGASRLL